MAAVTPGIRKPDGDSNAVKRVGDYQINSEQNLVCWPPKAEAPITLDKTAFVYRIHQNGTITVTGTIEVNSSAGTWSGHLRRGNWLEMHSRNYAPSITPNPQRRRVINDEIDHFHDDLESKRV